MLSRVRVADYKLLSESAYCWDAVARIVDS